MVEVAGFAVDLVGVHIFVVVAVVAVAAGRMPRVMAQHRNGKTMERSWKNVLKRFERAMRLTKSWDLRECKKAQGERAG